MILANAKHALKYFMNINIFSKAKSIHGTREKCFSKLNSLMQQIHPNLRHINSGHPSISMGKITFPSVCELRAGAARFIFLFMFIQQQHRGGSWAAIYSLTLLINMRKEEFITGARNLFFAKGEFNQAAASICK